MAAKKKPAGRARKKPASASRVFPVELSSTRLRQNLVPETGDSVLRCLLKIALSKLSMKDLQSVRRNISKFMFDGGCSGSGIMLYSIAELCDLLQVQIPKLTHDIEMEQRKAVWLHNLHKKIYGNDDDYHVFR